MRVTLSSSEMISAGTVGLLRRIVSLGKLVDRMHSPDANPWQIDIEGAMAEYAFAKSINRCWSPGINTFKAGDIGKIQVRSTQGDKNSLIIRDNDKDDDIFVLVIGTAPRYNIIGWIKGKNGKDPRWRRDPNGRDPAYFVPQAFLSDVGDLHIEGEQ